MTRPAGRAGQLAAWLPAVAWMALIFALSSGPSGAERLPRWWLFPGIDKLGHLFEYMVLALLLRRPLQGTALEAAAGHAGAVILVTSLYGATDELHQYFVPSRSMELSDWIFDTLAAMLGAALPLQRSATSPLRARPYK